MEIFMTIAVFIFIPVCILLVLTILLQDSKGGGLSSSAFGASEMQSILGGKGSADFLTKMTTWAAVAFIVISLVLMRFYGNIESGALKTIGAPETQSLETQTEVQVTDEKLETPATDDTATDNQAETDNQTPESTDETTEPAETEQ